jgi:single-strand DNA-binding protein
VSVSYDFLYTCRQLKNKRTHPQKHTLHINFHNSLSISNISDNKRLYPFINDYKRLNTGSGFPAIPSLQYQSAFDKHTNQIVNTQHKNTNIMNALKNKVQLIGNLGGDPELKILEAGKKVARFRMATNEVYKNNKGEKITETQWHNIIAWGSNAELAEKLLQKGTEVMIEGKLMQRQYVDKDGVKRYSTEVQASDFFVITRKVA